MFELIIFLPLICFITCIIFGRFLGFQGITTTIYYIWLTILQITCYVCYNIWNTNNIYFINCNKWIITSNFTLKISFILNTISVSMIIMIIIVSFLVIIFSKGYMENDPHYIRFISYLSLFVFFMIFLITSNNLFQIFLGWEGVGICSFLLINFWYTRIEANKSSIKAVLVNKIGDIGLLLSLCLLINKTNLLNFNSYFCYFNLININIEIITILILLGVIGKSAQIGLHIWLPDAMEGPTPVSALIHAATMVTAGIFLIIRLSPLFENSSLSLIMIIFIGGLTILFSGIISCLQNDIKKIIAYSTCSQLGYMAVICGFSYYDIALFHLINHGMFKALLFLCAGSVIHSMNECQDIRKHGNIINNIPITYISMLIASLSLMAFPFLTGNYSKDLIIEIIYSNHYFFIIFYFTLLGSFLTTFYSIRLLYLSFFFHSNNNINLIYENNIWIIIPLVLLVIYSMIWGFFTQMWYINELPPIIISNIIKLCPLITNLLSVILIINLFYFYNKFYNFILYNYYIQLTYNFIINLFWFNNLIYQFITKPIITSSYHIFYKFLDNQILEIFGPTYIINEIKSLTSKISNYHTGKLTQYLLITILFIIIFIFL